MPSSNNCILPDVCLGAGGNGRTSTCGVMVQGVVAYPLFLYVSVVGLLIVTEILQELVMCVLSVSTGSQIHYSFGADTWLPGRKSDQAVKFPGRRSVWITVEYEIHIFVPICLVWDVHIEKTPMCRLTWKIILQTWVATQECFVHLLQICVPALHLECNIADMS